jgi:uncharacterized repeat protein (TIGR01451 family)
MKSIMRILMIACAAVVILSAAAFGDSPTSITKTANYTTLPYFPYSGLVFTINYGNNTGAAINNYQIWDTLPTYYTPATIYDGGSDAGDIIIWNIGTLGPGASGAVSFTADVWSSAGPVVINHAMDSMGATSQVSINQPSPTVTNTLTLTAISGSTTPTFTVTPTFTPYVFGSMTRTFTQTPTMTLTATYISGGMTSLTKTAAPATADYFSNITYVISYQNNTAGDILNYQILDTIPSNISFANCFSCTNTAGVLTWNIGTLAPGGSGLVSWTGTFQSGTRGNCYPNIAIDNYGASSSADVCMVTFTPTLTVLISGSTTPTFTTTPPAQSPTNTYPPTIVNTPTRTFTVTWTPTTIVSVTPVATLTAGARIISGNIINPLKGESISIQFNVPSPCEVKIIVYDRNGRLVKILASGTESAGTYTVKWTGTSRNWNVVSAGIYVIYVKICSYEKKLKVVVRK